VISRRHVVALASAAVAAAIAGGAIAATRSDSPTARSQAIIADAAGQLGIPASKLTGALQKAVDNQIDAAVKDGKLTQQQADAFKQRVDSGDVPLVGGFAPRLGGFRDEHGHRGGRHGGGFGPAWDVVTTYLGITKDELRTELRSGKSLAQIATAHGKTADGLVQAMLDAVQKRLDAAVKAGKMSATQEQAFLSRLKDFFTRIVNATPRTASNGHTRP
jgi:polyhydroxyalkanoate synthesis regulator phasin